MVVTVNREVERIERQLTILASTVRQRRLSDYLVQSGGS